MDEEKVKMLIERLRLNASLDVMSCELLSQAADVLEELSEIYKQDVILGSYVSKTGIMRHLARGAAKYPDFRVDMNSLNAWVCGYPNVSIEEARKRLLETGGRDFRISTPKGDIRVYAKHPFDDPRDCPGVFIDAVNWDGTQSVPLCMVEYDRVADGIYCRIYEDGEEPSDSIRFENLDKGNFDYA